MIVDDLIVRLTFAPLSTLFPLLLIPGDWWHCLGCGHTCEKRRGGGGGISLSRGVGGVEWEETGGRSSFLLSLSVLEYTILLPRSLSLSLSSLHTALGSNTHHQGYEIWVMPFATTSG